MRSRPAPATVEGEIVSWADQSPTARTIWEAVHAGIVTQADIRGMLAETRG